MSKKSIGIGIGVAIIALAIITIVGGGTMSQESQIIEQNNTEENTENNPEITDEGQTFTLNLADGITASSSP